MRRFAISTTLLLGMASVTIAADRFDERVNAEPTNPNAYYSRGLARMNAKSYDQALADFNHAIELDPKNATFYDGRGLAHSRSGDAAKAHHDYSKAIKMNPDYPMSYKHRGENMKSYSETKEGKEYMEDNKFKLSKRRNYVWSKNLAKTGWQPIHANKRDTMAPYFQMAQMDLAKYTDLQGKWNGREGYNYG
ncbi:MAG: tetratricopeptide repeat protein, partial [Planctomycetales bacterium]